MDLDTYLTGVQGDMEVMIRRYFGEGGTPLDRAASHLLSAGGKRLRPAVLLLSADAVKRGSAFDLSHAALAIELIHTFTLIHDDIMDGDAERRGVPTVHTLWDEPTAILAGDVLYAKAFEFLCRAPAPDNARIRAVSLLARTCAEICEGQHMDMSFEEKSDVSEPEYLDMVRRKTGVLYAAAASLGSILAGGKPTQSDALYQYGLAAGIGFQIQDDLIDLLATSDVSGKDRASDIREGKKTLITIKAQEMGVDLSPWQRLLTDTEADSLVKMLEEEGVLPEVRSVAAGIVETGKRALAILPDSDEKQMLLQVSDHFITRGF